MRLAADGVTISRRMAEVFDGQIEVLATSPELRAKLSFPVAQDHVVLAVEDNADTLQLWGRYVEGSAFSLVALQDPARALSMARALHPALIVLDVMMPDVDGWHLLRSLRDQPETASIPVIVCTVLPQEALARSQGASAFLRKPATRQTFLSVLEQQIAAATAT